MSITHRQALSLAVDGGQSLTGSFNEVGTSKVEIDAVFAPGTDVLYTISFAVANMQSFMLLSDQNMTIKTNSSGSPANTINLIAGNPMIWSKSAGYFANPFTTNVTAFYVTNATGARLRFKNLIA